ncbi:MAG: squalene synthase HpnC [Planctomycetota bacterium]
MPGKPPAAPTPGTGAAGSAPQDPSALARDHYENFPVGSWLVPRALRRPIHLCYAFARTADDLADEARDHEALRALRADLDRSLAEPGAPAPAAAPFLPELARTIHAHALPVGLFHDLLDAFEQDCVQARYADLDALLAYCRKSADPIGRLLLHLAGVVDDEALARSDRICTALQVLNHCQDVRADYRERGRIYVPQDMLRRNGVAEAELGGDRTGPGLQECLGELGDLVARGFAEGWPLTRRLGGRLGLELRAIVHAAALGLRRMQRSGFRVLEERPRLGRLDLPLVFLRALVGSWPPRVARL